MHAKIAAVLCICSLATLAPPVAAQQEPLAISRLSAPIVVDGRLDDAAWAAVQPLPLTMYQPVFGGTPTQRSEIRVAYDDENFYAAGWFYDDDASGIRINSLYRDRWNGDDAFAIYIDAFNDNTNAKWFGTTPGGIRFDQLVSDDGLTLNGNWDGFWDARTTVTRDGWFAEVRIPFSTLGFQAHDGQAVMGLTVTRLVSRINERVTFPAIDPKLQFRQPSAARDIVLTGVRSSTPIYVTPYIMTGVQQQPTLAPGAAAFSTRNTVPREAGLDLRYVLSSRLTVDATVNTDFAQVEADDEQVNLDRFSLYVPEKRRFFQERSELFDFAMGGGARLFHSRQIGLAGEERIPVLAGSRVVGRVGDWDVGMLEIQTQGAGAIAAENFGVARARRGVLNAYSNIGAMVTSRIASGDYNLATGVDGVFRVAGNSFLTARLAQTFDTDDENAALLDRGQYYVRFNRPVTKGLQLDVNASRSGAAYRPELGFQPRSDYTSANAFGNYYFLTDSHPVLQRVYPGALAFSTFRNRDGALESGMWALWVEWDTKAGGGGWIEPKVFHENVAEAFTIGNKANIPVGAYTFADLQLALSMGSGAKLRTDLDARAGTYFDGTRRQIILTPTWNVSPRLELGAEYQLTMLRFPKRAESVDIQVARLRVRGALDARASLNAFVQYNSTTNRMGLNFRFRYGFSEGTDLWLVYDETLATSALDDVDGLRPPRSKARALVIKYTHTFHL